MKVKCPTCKKETEWEGNTHRPFCSERCQLIDLGAWADEKHAIPDDHQATEDHGERDTVKIENQESEDSE